MESFDSITSGGGEASTKWDSLAEDNGQKAEVDSPSETLESDSLQENDTEVSAETPERNLDEYGQERFIVSPQKIKEYKSRPDIFTYMIDSENGVALEKDKVIGVFEKMVKAKLEVPQDGEDKEAVYKRNEKNIQMMRQLSLATEISPSGTFSDEEMARFKRLKAGDLYQMKTLGVDKRSLERRLAKLDQNIAMWKAKFNELNKMNVVSKFLNKGEINSVKEQVLSSMSQRKECWSSLLDVNGKIDKIKSRVKSRQSSPELAA